MRTIIHDCIKQYEEGIHKSKENEEEATVVVPCEFTQAVISSYIGILHNHAKICILCKRYLQVKEELRIKKKIN